MENRLKWAGVEAERWLGKAIIQVAGTRSGMAGEWVVEFRHLRMVSIELLGEGCERAESLFLVLTGRVEWPFTRMKALWKNTFWVESQVCDYEFQRPKERC